MPYIPVDRRKAIDRYLDLPQTSGELNYLLTVAAKEYLATHGLSYKTINDIVGAFDGAKAEFQRRVVAPYEDAAIERNGDVY